MHFLEVWVIHVHAITNGNTHALFFWENIRQDLSHLVSSDEHMKTLERTIAFTAGQVVPDFTLCLSVHTHPWLSHCKEQERTVKSFSLYSQTTVTCCSWLCLVHLNFFMSRSFKNCLSNETCLFLSFSPLYYKIYICSQTSATDLNDKSW